MAILGVKKGAANILTIPALNNLQKAFVTLRFPPTSQNHAGR